MIQKKSEIDEMIIDLGEAYSALVFSFKILNSLEREDQKQVYTKQTLDTIHEFKDIEQVLASKIEDYNKKCSEQNLPINLIYRKLLKNLKSNPL